MLLEKPISKNDVITIKTIAGEEVIATFIDETDNHLTVGKPTSIAQGPQGMGMIPWMMTAKAEKISLNKNSVVAYSLTDNEIAKGYTEATTGIQLAT